MKIEDDIRQALHDRADQVQSDGLRAWERLQTGRPEPRVRGRIVAGVVAFAVFTLAAALVWRAFTPGPTPVQPAAVSYTSAPKLAAALHDAGLGCDNLGFSWGILQPGVDVRPCQVNGEEVWLWIFQTPEALRGFQAQRPPQDWGGVWNLRGPNWLVATTSATAAEAVRGVLGGELLGGTGTSPSVTVHVARYFFSSSGISGVFEVDSSPPSICFSTQSFGTLPISIVSASSGDVVASYAPTSNEFCDTTVSQELATDLIANPGNYQVSWQPIAGGATVLSSFTGATIPST